MHLLDTRGSILAAGVQHASWNAAQKLEAVEGGDWDWQMVTAAGSTDTPPRSRPRDSRSADPPTRAGSRKSRRGPVDHTTGSPQPEPRGASSRRQARVVKQPGPARRSTRPGLSSIARIADHLAAHVDDGRLSPRPHHQIHVAGMEGDLDETVRLAFTERRAASEPTAQP